MAEGETETETQMERWQVVGGWLEVAVVGWKGTAPGLGRWSCDCGVGWSGAERRGERRRLNAAGVRNTMPFPSVHLCVARHCKTLSTNTGAHGVTGRPARGESGLLLAPSPPHDTGAVPPPSPPTGIPPLPSVQPQAAGRCPTRAPGGK